MTCPSLCRSLVAVALLSAVTLPARRSERGQEQDRALRNPVTLDTTGLFQATFVSVADDMFIGGQLTEKALRELRTKGVTTVVNLRMPQEMARVGYDEAALVKEFPTPLQF